MVEHWSEKPGVDSSILSLGTFLLLKTPLQAGFFPHEPLIVNSHYFAPIFSAVAVIIFTIQTGSRIVWIIKT